MKTTYLKHKLLEHLTGKTAYTKPTNTFIGLLTADPTVTGSTANEVAGGSYSRKQASWASAANGKIATNAQLQWTNMPSSNVKYWAIFDAASGGNMLEYFAFDQSLTVTAGMTFTVESGNLMLRDA